MELFKNYSFIRSFTYYIMTGMDTIDLSKNDARQEELLHTIKQILQEDDNPELCLQRLHEHILSLKEYRPKHYDDYLYITNNYKYLNERDIYNLYAVMFHIIEEQIISFPVAKVLYEKFHLIVSDILNKGDCSVPFTNDMDLRSFKNELYRVLSSYAIKNVPISDMTICCEDSCNNIQNIFKASPAEMFEDYEKLNCYLYYTDHDAIERIKQASYLPGYLSSDIDCNVFLIGNIITFINSKSKDAISIQIIKHEYFESYEIMFQTLGVNAFGYSDEKQNDYTKKIEECFSQYDPESPVALRIKRLIKPIITKEDYIELQNNDLLYKE